MKTAGCCEKKRIVRNAFVICALAVLCLNVTACGPSDADEATNERNDLYAMYDADLTAQLQIKDGSLPDGEYWFDVSSFCLQPVSEEKPTAYGLGTTKSANGLAAFVNETGVSYDYHENQDYTNKVVRVTVSGGAISVEWE